MNAPWWAVYLPDVEAVAWAVAGGMVITQMWKLWREDAGRKPRAYQPVAVSVVVTTMLATIGPWLTGVDLRVALAGGLKIGPAAPLIWLAAKWAMRRWAPGLARVVGEDRRSPWRSERMDWTEDDSRRE